MKNKIVLICLFVVLKLAFFLYLSNLSLCNAPDRALGSISMISGDSFSYTGAMENYVTSGDYYFFNGKRNVYAGRMPHYAAPYYFLRQFLSKKIAIDIFIFLQFLVEIIASLYLINLVYQVFGSKITMYLSGLFILFASNWTNFTYHASPESLSISFLVLFVYWYYQFKKSNEIRAITYSALFLSFLVVLKSYFGPVYLLVGLDLLLVHKKDFKSLIKNVMVYSIPLIILLTPWVIRNFAVMDRFIPLQENSTAGYNYSESEMAFRRYVSSWGGDIIYWEKTAAGCYFIPKDHLLCDFKFPTYVWTENVDQKRVEKVRNEFVDLQVSYDSLTDQEIASKFDVLTSDYKSSKPFRYFIISPIVLVKKFLVNSGAYYLPISSGNDCYHPIQLPIKLGQVLIYWLSVTFGFFGLIIMIRKKQIHWIILAIIFLIIIIFPITLRITEWRYFRTIQPLLYIGLMVYIPYIDTWIRRIIKSYSLNKLQS